MGVKRKTTVLRKGEIIDVEEYHDGNYGSPGKRREKKAKATNEQMQKINAYHKMRRARQRLLEYFDPGDLFATWTYEPRERPKDMKGALRDFKRAIGKVRKEYKKRGKPLFWIRNIERGTKGAWHIHLVVKEIGESGDIIRKAWPHGGTYLTQIRKNEKIYDEDFTKLASYLTKDARTTKTKKDGSLSLPRIREASYGTSRNMPLPLPKEERLVRWKKEPESKKGYYLLNVREGINPVTGYQYRRYTMIRLRREEHAGKRIHRGRQPRTEKETANRRLRAGKYGQGRDKDQRRVL